MAESGPPSPSRPASTLDLITRAKVGDRDALEELCRRHADPLRRWARGRLPRWTRDLRDTEDLVQDTLLQTLRNVGGFEAQNEGALQAYLRQAILNRIRDEVRRVGRRRGQVAGLEADVDVEDPTASPLEEAIGREALERYESALARLRPEDRHLIIARVELQQGYSEMAAACGKPSAAAVRMALARALVRLAEEMDGEG